MNQEKFFEILQYAAAAADKAGEFCPAEKRDIDDMLRYGRTATGATLANAPRNEAELEALLLAGHGVAREWSRERWLDHVRSGGRFAKFPNLDALKGHYADEIRLGDIGDWDEFEAYKLQRACSQICHLAGRHWLYSLATTSSPEAMAKGGTIASRMSESSRGSLVLSVDGSRHVCKLSGCTGDKNRHYNFEGWSAPGKFSNLEFSEKRDALAFLAKHGKKISLIIH